MKVYVVKEGCYYDGVSIKSIHWTEEGAVNSAKNIVMKSRMHEYIKATLEDFGNNGILHCWKDEEYEYDILEIQEYEVQL